MSESFQYVTCITYLNDWCTLHLLPTHGAVMSSIGLKTIVNYINDDDLRALQSLLENQRVNVDDRDENGATALHVAASKGKLAFVRELLNGGADVNSEDGDNWTALLCAAKEGHADICTLLLDSGADIEHKDMGGWSALVWASYKGRTEVARCLLERNGDVHAQGNFHISSLIWAAGRGHSDIYGTSALVWACRQGNVESVSHLLKAGANVDAVGMYSWTALLVASMGGHIDIVNVLLKSKVNVNAKDKDGCTALSIACKEGYEEIVAALLNEGAYINIQDRAGDSGLIHAVKGGHRPAVEALLKKYADANLTGKDHKTALYWAVEKSNFTMVKLLLSATPDLEIATKDGDTPLLKAVRNRNTEIVQLLLEKKAKAIVEVLLRNPKHSQLLYRPNKNGETPYNLDMKHNKTILGQIFGQRRLNTTQDNEKLLGYDLYSSALADFMSDPLMTMPITVGLFAKWGSGKSFLLSKLKEEMKGFAQQWVEPTFSFTILLFVVLCHVALLLGVSSGLIFASWEIGLSIGFGVFALIYVILLLIWYGAQRLDWYWPYNVSIYLARKLAKMKLVLQVLFCHPASNTIENNKAQPIRFYFTEQAKVSSSTGGESCLLHMMGSLYDALEEDYGSWAPRLYRAFRPVPVQARSPWQWRKLCCVPYCLLWLLLFACSLVLSVVVFIWLNPSSQESNEVESLTLQALAISLGLVLSIAFVANLFTFGRALQALVLSQKRQLNRTLGTLGTLKGEGFMHQMKAEVNLMTSMVECLDSFFNQQTRLVIIVDGLDSAEQDKVLQVLDAVGVLFSETGAPFIVLLAIDPHIIAKALDANTQRVFTESSISGHSFVRNLVHLPFFLQNSASGRAKVAQQHAAKRMLGNSREHDDTMMAVSRRLSSESSSGVDRLKAPPASNSRKSTSNIRRLWPSESVASSLASNLNRAGTGFDPSSSKGFMLSDDYFSDVTPRTRLLRSFQIEFNWYHLATWVNLSEQWPYRLSWMVLYHETFEEILDDSTSLKNIYEKLKPLVPASKDIEPLLELDRDEKKLEIFLSNHRANLLVGHLRLFLSFTINLDPYLKKVIKEENVGVEEIFIAPGHQQHQQPMNVANQAGNTGWTPGWNNKPVNRRHRTLLRAATSAPTAPLSYPHMLSTSMMGWPTPPQQTQTAWEHTSVMPRAPPPPPGFFQEEVRLSTMNVDQVCDILPKIEELSPATMISIQTSLKENNVGGKVLSMCELSELKQVLNLNFGDWEIFKWLITMLRQQEISYVSQLGEDSSLTRNVRFAAEPTLERKGSVSNKPGEKEKSRIESRPKPSFLEKQTLSEEACEDVLEEPGTPVLCTPATSSPVQSESPALHLEDSVRL
ncbi:hypothetical protein B566_EDAN008099 [Ephemera danica]|nr:hypothetical protein B566_EDAN008099 [Ephemera danica]